MWFTRYGLCLAGITFLLLYIKRRLHYLLNFLFLLYRGFCHFFRLRVLNPLPSGATYITRYTASQIFLEPFQLFLIAAFVSWKPVQRCNERIHIPYVFPLSKIFFRIPLISEQNKNESLSLLPAAEPFALQRIYWQIIDTVPFNRRTMGDHFLICTSRNMHSSHRTFLSSSQYSLWQFLSEYSFFSYSVQL